MTEFVLGEVDYLSGSWCKACPHHRRGLVWVGADGAERVEWFKQLGADGGSLLLVVKTGQLPYAQSGLLRIRVEAYQKRGCGRGSQSHDSAEPPLHGGNGQVL